MLFSDAITYLARLNDTADMLNINGAERPQVGSSPRALDIVLVLLNLLFYLLDWA